MEPYWEVIKRIIKESDIILEVLDARLIELSRNEEVERLIKEIGRPTIFVINKSDLIDKREIKKQSEELRRKENFVIFVSNRKPKTIHLLLYLIKKVFKKYGKAVQTDIDKNHRVTRSDIVVGVVGYPNVGKSSVINALAHKNKAKVSKRAGTTHGIHWIRLNKEIKLIDSPGVIPLRREDEIRYGLIGARDIESLKNPSVVVNALIKYFFKKDKDSLEKFYGIEITEEEVKNEDVYSVVLKVAKKKNFLLKGGVLDENRAEAMILKDWQEGRLRFY